MESPGDFSRAFHNLPCVCSVCSPGTHVVNLTTVMVHLGGSEGDGWFQGVGEPDALDICCKENKVTTRGKPASGISLFLALGDIC